MWKKKEITGVYSMLVLIGCLVLVSTLLTGCGSKVEESLESESNPALHEISENVEWDGLTLDAITPVCSYETSGDELHIFPYNDNDSHITVKLIFTSINAFWKSVEKSYKDTDNIAIFDNYSLVTNEDGVTYGLLRKDKESAYLVYADTLPSSYVGLVLEELWNAST